jgi:hypothetical protein
MNFQGWKYYTNPQGENVGIVFFHQHGCQESRLLTDPDVMKWLSEGNVPKPADQPME